MRFFFLTLFSLTLFCRLSASSVNVYNDSPYTLTAEVLSAQGTSLGKLKIAPQHQQAWQDYSGGAPVWSQTPYTVIFTCPNGKQYGIFRNVQPGATITAQASAGDLYCEPEKKEQQEQEGQEQQDQKALKTDSIWGPP